MSLAIVITLLAVSALVVDVANARQHRTQLQTSADAAALAAAQDLPDTTRALQTAKAMANENYDIPTSAWVGCDDPDHLLDTPEALGGNTCISFNSDSTVVRVRLPDQAIATFFGSALGRDEIGVTAAATAGSYAPPTERVVPAAVTAVMGTGLLCLENSGNDVDCASRASGNFGSIYSPRINAFRPEKNELQTSEAINYAMNVDHDLVPWDGGTRICDGNPVAPCDTSNELGGGTANWLVVSTGNDVPPVTEGFVTGFKADTTDMGKLEFCGRLTRPDFTPNNVMDPYPDNCTPGEPTTTAAGTTINGRHIYFWMTDEARKTFYPEVASLGLADTAASLAVGASVYAQGDERLACYVSGYRFDAATDTTTVPDCTHLGLPGSNTTATHDMLDHFTSPTLANNEGTHKFSSDWIELSESDGAATGAIRATSGSLVVTLGKYPEVVRTADLSLASHPGRTAGPWMQGGWKHSINDEDAALELQLSPDGVTWRTVLRFDQSRSTSGGFSAGLNAAEANSDQLRVRLVQVGEVDDGLQEFQLDYLRLYWDESTATGTDLGPLFRKDMRYDPRYGVVPQVVDWPATGEKASELQGFWSTFTYHIYDTDTKVKGFDGWVMDPALIEGDPNVMGMAYGFAPEKMVRLIR